jgi:hypothetical protein
VVMAWAIDRLGRSLIDLLGTIQHLEACGVDLYFDEQSIDNHCAHGQARLPGHGRICRVRTVVDPPAHKRGSQARCRPGQASGAAAAEPEKLSRARRELAKGIGEVLRIVGLGAGTVHRLKREMAAG